MKITIDIREGDDFPYIEAKKRANFKEKIKEIVRTQLELRPEDIIKLNIEYKVEQ
jgi:hypothetical protein